MLCLSAGWLVCPGPWLREALGHIATEMYMNIYSPLRMTLYQSILKTNTQIFVKFVMDIHSPHYVCGDPLTFALVSPSGYVCYLLTGSLKCSLVHSCSHGDIYFRSE